MTSANFIPPDLYLGETLEEGARYAIAYLKADEFYQENPDGTVNECMTFLEKEGF